MVILKIIYCWRIIYIMKFKDLLSKLNKELEDNPEIGDNEVFLWDEHNETYVGFDGVLKYPKVGFVEKCDEKASRFDDYEVFLSVKDYNDTFNTKCKKEDLSQIVLL